MLESIISTQTPQIISKLVTWLGLWSALSLPNSDSSNIVDIGYAKYEGNRTFPNSVAYLGIPYAEPPLGNLRFRAPVPLNTTRVAIQSGGATFDATEYPDFCVQGTSGVGDAGGAGSEDCLKLNVYTPAGAKEGSNLPVLYYMHGGGYVFGNPRNWPYDHWIHQNPNVVVVSVYYRLDSLGFLASPDFIDNPDLGDLNAGFQDQIQGLKWVKEYISAFGGDPSKVTIDGESAGGSSVELHLVADEGEKLFSGAIAQSVFRTPLPLPEQQQDLFDYYAQEAGCGTGQISVQMECLRSASVSSLARAQDDAFYHSAKAYREFRPVVDGKIIKDYPTRLIAQGKFARVPLMVGATSNETLAEGDSITSALQSYWPMFTNSDVDELLELYPLSDFESSAQQQLVLTGDATVRCAGTIMADAVSRVMPSWTYRYDQPARTDNTTMVKHLAENWMMFLGTFEGVNGTTTFTGLNEIEEAFAEEMIAYWLSFVRTGNPNTYRLSKSPIWYSYSIRNPVRAVLTQDPNNVTTKSGVWLERTPDVESERCRFIAAKVEHEQA